MDDPANAEKKYPEQDVNEEILASSFLQKNGDRGYEDTEDNIENTHSGADDWFF